MPKLIRGIATRTNIEPPRRLDQKCRNRSAEIVGAAMASAAKTRASRGLPVQTQEPARWVEPYPSTFGRNGLYGCAHPPSYAELLSECKLCIRSRPSCTATLRCRTASCAPRRSCARAPKAAASRPVPRTSARTSLPKQTSPYKYLEKYSIFLQYKKFTQTDS